MAWRLLQYNRAFDAFVAECTPEMLDALRPRLAQLAQKGNMATYPITEPLGDGLLELRAKWKRIRMRLLFGYLPGQRIVFVWGGTKDQRRLRPETIRRARVLLAEAIATQEKINVAQLH
jgi:hypothetical protein